LLFITASLLRRLLPLRFGSGSPEGTAQLIPFAPSKAKPELPESRGTQETHMCASAIATRAGCCAATLVYVTEARFLSASWASTFHPLPAGWSFSPDTPFTGSADALYTFGLSVGCRL
jgi:hypothetical protein